MLFTTICTQLLKRILLLVTHVQMALDTDPNISDKLMGEQFEKLICQPLSHIQRQVPLASKLIIVIDALDECAQDGDTLLRLLSQTRNKWSLGLQIFITSRPEQQIRSGFADVPEEVRENKELHLIPQPIIKQDITTFLKDRFAQIQEKYMKDGRSLSSDWPGLEAMSALVEMSVPLFIFAATLCRFVEDTAWSDPMGQLKKVLEYRGMKSDSEIDRLDATYSPTLNQLIHGRPEKAQKSLVTRFRRIVGTIIHLAEPLSQLSLASLLNIDSQQIEGQLSSLHSVLSVPSSADSPIKMLHLSFRDFLVHPETRKTSPFWIDETETHKMIMVKCLERMSQPKCLRENICSLENHGTLRAEIDPSIITECLPPDVRYACRFWVFHLEQSKSCIGDHNAVHVFLQGHFLSWLEALSRLGRISESLSMIHRLETLVNDRDMGISQFLGDAMQFIQKYSLIIDRAPLQLYSSALIFSPKASIIRNTFIEKIPIWIRKLPDVESAWGALLQTLETHVSPDDTVALIDCVAFSEGGKLASGSSDRTVKLWDPATGKLQQTLGGYSKQVRAVAFSPDGKLVASGSGDRTIKLWDPGTGVLQLILKGHSKPVHTVAFSPDGKLLETNTGRFNIESLYTGEVSTPSHPYNVLVMDEWILRNNVNTLWLPVDYRATCSAVYYNMLALGHWSGRVTFLELA